MAFGLICAGGLTTASPSLAADTTVVVSDESKHAGEFIIPINKSQVLRIDQQLRDLLVGNPEIADVLALTDRSIYVLGKSLGSTSLTLYGENKALIAVLDLIVSADIGGLKARLFEVMPKEKIEVRPVNGGIMLSGKLSSSSAVSRALKIANQFASGGPVTNLMSISGSQQVMLKVRFSEVSRTAGKELGLNFDVNGSDFFFTNGPAFLANPLFLSGASNLITLASPNSFGSGFANFDIGSTDFNFLYEALESKGIVKTLAEPNLIALTGDTATFLAGGEFPIPVENDDSISIEFREFGISMGFTPTVLEDGLINLVLTTEVSAIDANVSSVVAGVGVPGLATNRATTTVELRDGQSFAIAGLLQDDFQDAVQQLPYLGDIPVLGALFRSSDYQRAESELVVAVTAHLVQPAPDGTIALPTDRFVPPSDADLFLFGRLESPQSGGASAAAGTFEAQVEQARILGETANAKGTSALATQGAGGIDGVFGHIIK